MSETGYEVNFDGIVGPTHNYAGLSYGNLASRENQAMVSHPKEAALQGLAKMKFLVDLGIKQAVLPPHDRPDLRTLRQLGFGGSDEEVIAKAAREDPRLLASVYSASSMWAANAATVSPSADADDRKVHFTPANLVTQFHRSLEPPHTARCLRAIFADESAFAHHAPLPPSALLADEGAANHTRLSSRYGERGVEVFVYGRHASSNRAVPTTFPARQTFEGSSAIARLHRLSADAVLFLQQGPAAIDAGAFHNDVVAVGNQNVFLYHAQAYGGPGVGEELRRCFERRGSSPLWMIEVPESRISLRDAVESYLFNSQIVTLSDGTMALIAPVECREIPAVADFVTELTSGENPIRAVHYLDVRQSMRNGGGPACLRLRVILTARELALAHPGVFLTDALYQKLVEWVGRHYRDRLAPEDLADPRLALEGREALDELTRLLRLGDMYDFQSSGCCESQAP